MSEKFRVATWNSVGYDVSHAMNLEEAIKSSGLDYEVRKMQVGVLDGEKGIAMPHRFATVRDNAKGGIHVYDVVSDKFEIIQNREAFDFVNYMGSDIKFVKAGETESGVVYIIGALPEVNILGDKFTPYAIFRNGFNGKVKITAAICPLRIVCQNQFNFAFDNTQNSMTIRHVQNAEAKLQEAKEVLKMSASYMERLTTVAEKYSMFKFSNEEVQKIVNRLFPIPEDTSSMNAFKLHRLEEQRDRFITAHDADDNSNFRNTAWGLVNAYTDFITHNPAMGKTHTKEENKFVMTVFHPALMNKIISMMRAVKA